MDAEFSAAELTRISGGKWFNLPEAETLFRLTTDTRQENSGRIFFALAGERFDAHDFLAQAVDSGCAALCVSRPEVAGVPEKFPVLLVDDTLKAFQQCAKFHRMRFKNLTVFGVTGSVGKTSVKEMLRAICVAAGDEKSVLCTEGNTNNQIGVVQNLLRLNKNHRYAILEAGTSAPGEIAPLAAMIQPHGAIVNSIAPCHLENLLSLEGVATEKSALLQAVSPGGVTVCPARCAGAEILCRSCAGRKHVTFGMDGAGDVNAQWLNGSLDGSSFILTFPGGRSFEVNWHLTGRHNALNAAGAAALASACGITPETIVRALPHTRLPGMRMKKTQLNGVTYFNDAYNANPASMRALLTLLDETADKSRLILCLGGMRELGGRSIAEHTGLLQFVAGKFPGVRLITIGREFENIPGNGKYFPTSSEAEAYLASIVRPGDLVAAKGSFGNHTELALPEAAR